MKANTPRADSTMNEIDEPLNYTPGWAPFAENPYFSNLGEDAEPELLVELAYRRHEIERFYQDAKNELGFGHYEGRLWYGLHRDPTFVMWAYSRLAAERRPLIERLTDSCLPANVPA